MKKMILLPLVFASLSAFAGTRQDYLECSNKDKSVVIDAVVPGDTMDFSVKVKIKGLFEGELTSGDYDKVEANGTLSVYNALADGVYTLKLARTGISQSSEQNPFFSMSLHAIPTSVSKLNKEPGQSFQNFTAKGSGFIYPDKSGRGKTTDFTLNCKIIFPNL